MNLTVATKRENLILDYYKKPESCIFVTLFASWIIIFVIIFNLTSIYTGEMFNVTCHLALKDLSTISVSCLGRSWLIEPTVLIRKLLSINIPYYYNHLSNPIVHKDDFFYMRFCYVYNTQRLCRYYAVMTSDGLVPWTSNISSQDAVLES